MDVLEKVIFNLTSDEVRRFKILSNRFKADDEKKLILLFDYIRSEKFADEEQAIVVELYQQNTPQTRNRYYRLRNKLLENIEKSLTFYHFKYKDSIHAYYDVQLSIMFRERGSYGLALYFLKKAEKKAKEMDQFNILEVIYQEYTQLALKDIEIDIEDILSRRKTNLDKLKIHRRNTEAIALITQQLKRSNFSREKASVIDLLERTQRSIEESAEIFHSTEGKIQIFRVVSASLLQKEAYGQLVTYTENMLSEFEKGNLFTIDNHPDRLMMRVWLANALFRCSRFSDAEQQLQVLHKEMLMHSKQNYFAYLFYYTNTSVNVLKCLGKTDAAGQLLQEALATKEIRSNPEAELYLVQSLADQMFIVGNHAQALAMLKDSRNLAGYRMVHDEIRMGVEIYELVASMECGSYAEVESRVAEIRKSYKKLLKSEDHQSADVFLDILPKISAAVEKGKQPRIQKQVETLRGLIKPSQLGGNLNLSYAHYAESKLTGKNYYALFLQSVGNKAS